MSKKFVEKLVRDKILDEMKKNEKNFEYFVATGNDLLNWTKLKLVEESQEVLESSNIEELKKELADLFEIMYFLLKQQGIKYEEIEKYMEVKKELKGGFDKGIVIRKYF